MWSCLVFKSVEGGRRYRGIMGILRTQDIWRIWKFPIFVKLGYLRPRWYKNSYIQGYLISVYIPFYSKNYRNHDPHNIIIILIKMDLMWRPENQPVDDVEQDKSWREKHSWDTILIIFYHYYYDNIIIIYTYYAYCALSAFLHDLFCVFHPTCWRRRS